MNKMFVIVILQIFFAFLVISLITLFIRYNNSIKLEKRIAKYSVRYNKNKYNVSLYDKLKKAYLLFVKKQRKNMRKIFPTLSKRYEKYVYSEDIKAVDFVTHKFVIAFAFLVFSILALAIKGKMMTMFQFIVAFVIGFIVLDIILIIKKKISSKEIEEDILNAVIVMNSAFRSGKSIIQAVSITSEKVPGIVGAEFKKIEKELRYGLSIETVFNRFAKRIKVEEAEYLSSSLTILNKTGGNIVTVFNSIEKTLIDKMKLKEELKNSTMVSKLVVRILVAVPILFVIIVYAFDSTYFNPFFKSPLGVMFLSVIVIMFIIYVIILEKIVRVKY